MFEDTAATVKTDDLGYSLGQGTLSMVYAAMQLDLGLPGVQLMCTALGLPVFQTHTYKRYQERIQAIAEMKYKMVNDGVVKAIFEYYASELDIAPDSDGVLNIEVVFDGTWMTRGHSSLIGAGAVIEAHTGYVLDGHTLSRYCNACTYWERKVKEDRKLTAKYEKWKASHKCQKNFLESSGKMEAAAAAVLWSRSLGKKLRYTVFVGDGDSSANKTVCELNNGEGPYIKDCKVVKEECVNHVSKRVGSRLRALKKKLTVPVQTKTGKTIMRAKLEAKANSQTESLTRWLNIMEIQFDDMWGLGHEWKI